MWWRKNFIPCINPSFQNVNGENLIHLANIKEKNSSIYPP
jgi:hypothetical protein